MTYRVHGRFVQLKSTPDELSNRSCYVHTLIDHFWGMYQHEYTYLHERHMYSKKKCDKCTLKLDDVVITKDDNVDKAVFPNC